MSEKVKDDISRRKALSLLGGAFGLALVVDGVESEEAKAQAAAETPAAGAPAAGATEGGGTAGMKRRKARRTGRHERRHKRRTG
jgi:hypothetical protein